MSLSLSTTKFWISERDRLTERRTALAIEADTMHSRLTEITKELAMLDDVTRRLGAHLPDETRVEAIAPAKHKMEVA